jgi:serine phosphatase RsbU (regulator of sigma subunit)
LKVLIAEDDPVSRTILRRSVEKFGHECLAAEDGEKAWELFQETQEVDVIISDWMMPGIDGIEFCRRVRAVRNDVYTFFIFLTALGDRASLLEGMQAGADDYLTKPLDREELQVRLIAASRVNSLHRQLNEKRRQLEAEMSRAARVQAELLPNEAPELDGFEVAARCVPAREGGGDFYDWIKPGRRSTDPDCLALTLGDVMGKGMPAALLMATARAVLRALYYRNQPATTINLAAKALEVDLLRSASFLTLFHARLDVASRRLQYIDAGHGHAFVRRADGTLEKVREGGLPLGILPDEIYQEGSVMFGPGDALVLYSDGLVDAYPDSALDMATIAEHLRRATSAEEMVDRLVQIPPPTDSLPDDLTVVVLYCREES